ncbi:MAG: methyltransferase domain-containing protein [Alphaproteobacteria bacterium]|nr:methyltransferase domain-containing protein [Alphaproteobacteria bacterium]
MPTILYLVATGIIVVIGGLYLRKTLRTPIRHYEGPASVSNIYDTWTNDRILEITWGEHLHAGHYGDPAIEKAFIAAKVDFIDEMIEWGITAPHPKLRERLENPGEATSGGLVRILDVGCGIGGSSRHMARRWPKTAHVTGITLSKAQAERAAFLAHEQEVANVDFLECDAMRTGFPDASFDVAWAVESEMHMPDKDLFVREMVRVLKPGGVLIIAAWNVRDTRGAPLSKAEADHVRLLVDEWAHAKFTSIPDYVEILEGNELVEVTVADWTAATQPSWRHTIREGLRNSHKMLSAGPKVHWRLVRDAYTMLRYDSAFRSGLCRYGMLRGQKAER